MVSGNSIPFGCLPAIYMKRTEYALGQPVSGQTLDGQTVVINIADGERQNAGEWKIKDSYGCYWRVMLTD